VNTTIRLGFIPLTDCAPLVIAQEKGWFRKHGLAVELVREPSWANIRDKVALGLLDGGHMLAPMPLAATLGLGGLNRAIVTALSLDLNGSAITVAKGLWQQMLQIDPQAGATPLAAVAALRGVIERRRARRGVAADLRRGLSLLDAQLPAAHLARGGRHRSR
jgi:nitrate/nitrite transport system substrate-binding protein